MSDLDGGLAWAINEWLGDSEPREVDLTRHNIESLTRHLTAAGFKRPVTDPFEGLKSLRPTLERILKLPDEFLGGKASAPTADSKG